MANGSELLPEDHEVVELELELFARAREVVRDEVARLREKQRREADSRGGLRALRDEASNASEDDLPQLLLELGVRQRLAERALSAALPDPDAPYFAHLRVREGGRPKDYLLGQASLVEPRSGLRIVDWRVAPVAQIFYRYREGDAYEETFPGRVAEGTVEARRIVVVSEGELTHIVSDHLALTRTSDGRWVRADRGALAGGGAGSAVRPGTLGLGAERDRRLSATELTARLDAEQFAAISAAPTAPLVVLGSAGSGKTTVALHRLARLTAVHPERFGLDRVEVIVPEEGLARLSRRLLEPLGVGRAQVSTLDDWSLVAARRVFGDSLPRVWFDAPGLVSSLKRHPALFQALQHRFAKTDLSAATLKKLRRRLAELLTDREFLAAVVRTSGGTLPMSAVEETVRHTLLQLADRVEKELRNIVDPALKRALDDRALDEGTPEELAGTIDVEDLPILLFMRSMRGALDLERRAHLVLDEAEDFSLFELSVLGKCLEAPPSLSLAGDEAQQTSSSFAGWPRSVAALGAKEPLFIRLAVSYRCPRPIAELARSVLGPLAADEPVRAAREGVPVGLFRFPHEAQAQLFLVGALRDLIEREPDASVAVLARDDDAARRLYELVAELPHTRHVRRGAFSFDPGIDVSAVDEAKGLEFDYVVVPDVDADAYPKTDDARRRLHVALTRASHQLWLLAGGNASPLIPWPGFEQR